MKAKNFLSHLSSIEKINGNHPFNLASHGDYRRTSQSNAGHSPRLFTPGVQDATIQVCENGFKVGVQKSLTINFFTLIKPGFFTENLRIQRERNIEQFHSDFKSYEEGTKVVCIQIC